MASLVFLHDEKKLFSFTLKQGANWIGRSKDCHLSLSNKAILNTRTTLLSYWLCGRVTNLWRHLNKEIIIWKDIYLLGRVGDDDSISQLTFDMVIL